LGTKAALIATEARLDKEVLAPERLEIDCQVWSPLKKELLSAVPEPSLAVPKVPEFTSEAAIDLLVRLWVFVVVTRSTPLACTVPEPLEIKLRLILVSVPVAETEGLLVVAALVMVNWLTAEATPVAFK